MGLVYPTGYDVAGLLIVHKLILAASVAPTHEKMTLF